ncbi:FHA domain-containing protein [Herbaspirillum sp. GCM10030257]|uniref:FHA domain-containing protein n=1 Tax=Herbaspirillum sp. GCM10030257 TaxID=3273393 RepID=UPI0036205B66
MPRIILSLGKKVLRELNLVQQRTTIGRAPHNDVVIDHPAISAEHAVITLGQDGTFLEDLNSTNGTQINGQPIRKHFLQDWDVINLAKYQIRYFVGEDNVQPTVNSSRNIGDRLNEGLIAKVEILHDQSRKKEIPLTKPLTTIGLPGAYIVVIKQCSAGYLVSRVEGSQAPSINGRQIGPQPEILRHGDLINVCNIAMRFCLA